MIAACFGPFHGGDPLVIVAEQWQVEERTGAVGLGTDWQLCQHPPHRLSATPIPCTGDRVLEPAKTFTKPGLAGFCQMVEKTGVAKIVFAGKK